MPVPIRAGDEKTDVRFPGDATSPGGISKEDLNKIKEAAEKGEDIPDGIQKKIVNSAGNEAKKLLQEKANADWNKFKDDVKKNGWLGPMMNHPKEVATDAGLGGAGVAIYLNNGGTVPISTDLLPKKMHSISTNALGGKIEGNAKVTYNVKKDGPHDGRAVDTEGTIKYSNGGFSSTASGNAIGGEVKSVKVEVKKGKSNEMNEALNASYNFQNKTLTSEVTLKIPKIKTNVNAGVQFKQGAVKSAHTKVNISDHWDIYGEKNDKETKVGINYKTSFK